MRAATEMSIDRTSATQRCMDDCSECAVICNEGIMYCCSRGGNHVSMQLMSILMDCADMCQMVCRAMTRSSGMSPKMCALCAEMCINCGNMCEQTSGDKMMMLCAEVCRRCAESCMDMAPASMAARL